MGNCLPKPRKRSRAGPAQSPREEKESIDEILSKTSKRQKQNQHEPVDMSKALNEEDPDENNTALECPSSTKKALAFTVDLGDDAPQTVSPGGLDDNNKAMYVAISDEPEDTDDAPNTSYASPDSPAHAMKALAFTVDIGEEKPKTSKPTRLKDRSKNKKEEPASEIVYTNDEESLMNAILMEAGDVKSEDTNVVGVKKSYTLDEKSLMADIMREDRLKEIKEKARHEEVKIYDAKRRRLVAERKKEAKVESKTTCCTPGVDVQRKNVRDLAAEDRRKAAERRRKVELE